MDLQGDFETHVTVRLDGDGAAPDDAAALRQWAEERGLKFTHIVLARGRTASQPMLTRHGRGRLADELARTETLAAALRSAGFVVARVKIEASPFAMGVPRSDEEAAGASDDQYFEHHVKLLLTPGADVRPLTVLAERHGAHLSRNALRTRVDGREERFVTQRCRRVARPAARRAFEALLAALSADGYEVTEAEEEFVVYDSDLSMDAGWIDAEGVGA